MQVVFMNKLPVIIALLLWNNLSVAQSRWSFGFTASPDISRAWTVSNIDTFSLADYPRSKVGYTVGFSAFKQLRKRLWLHTGLWFMHKQFVEVFPLYIENKLPEIATSTYTYNNFEIPLLLNYRFGKSRLALTTMFGAIVGFTTKQTTRTVSASYDNTYRGNTSNPSPDRFSINIGIGALYRLNDRFSLMAEPYLKTDISPLIKSALFDQSSRTLGLRMSLIFALPEKK